MEVPGRNALSQDNDKNTTSHFALYCVPCDVDGNQEAAIGYCQDCREHLCEICFRHHTKPTPLRHHILLDSNTMPTTQQLGDVTDEKDICKNHRSERIKFYCESHESVLCTVCATLQHRECKIEYIPDVAKKLIDSKSVDRLIQQLEEFETQCQSDITNAETHISKVERNRTTLVQEIKHFREEINQCLNDMEKEVSLKASGYLNSEEENTKSLKVFVRDILQDVKTSLATLKRLKAQNEIHTLFILLIRTKKRFKKLKLKLATESHFSRRHFRFSKNQLILNDIKRQVMGSVVSSPISLSIRKHETVECLPKDRRWLSGIAIISADELIVTDYDCLNAMLIDTKNNRLLSEISFNEEGPFDVTCLPDSRVAVTFIETMQIRFLSYSNQALHETKCIQLHFQCFGIAYYENKILVTSCFYTDDEWRDGKIFILNMEGVTLKQFCNSRICDIPEYINISREGKYFFIADAKDDAVKKLDWEGNVLNTFKMEGYEDPRGIQELDDETVLVCYHGANRIFRLTKELELCDVLMAENNIKRPTAIGYCRQTSLLFVTCVVSETSNASFANGLKKIAMKWNENCEK